MTKKDNLQFHEIAANRLSDNKKAAMVRDSCLDIVEELADAFNITALLMERLQQNNDPDYKEEANVRALDLLMSNIFHLGHNVLRLRDELPPEYLEDDVDRAKSLGDE